ncbi:MAG TPA: hypothetical protein VLT61_07235, partial [Anaeromyxobacteraceae bacterium]|nr:hypothetical protein [Anaeromyxobacteraceae bacterium]
ELVPGVVGRVARNKLVQKGAEIVAGELGGAVMMYPTERGMEFEQFLELKTADGKPIDVQVAGRASAVGAAVVSLLDAEGSRQVVLASGPWGRKLAGLGKETQRGFIRALLTNKETAESFGKFLLATSKPVLQGAAAEGGIEGLQDIVADLSGFFTKVFSGPEGEGLFGRLTAEAAQARPIESIASAAQTAVSTAVGVGVIAAPASGRGSRGSGGAPTWRRWRGWRPPRRRLRSRPRRSSARSPR